MSQQAKIGIVVRLPVKPGKEAEVEAFLHSGLGLAQQEPDTISWYALKLSPTTYAIFDTFTTESGRDAHLNGPIAKALMSKADEYFSGPLNIEKVEILAQK